MKFFHKRNLIIFCFSQNAVLILAFKFLKITQQNSRPKTGSEPEVFSTLIRLDASDTFVFAANFGSQEIANFQATGANHDVIQFDQSTFADFAAVLASAEQVGSDVVITHAADTLTLKNVSLGNLQTGDFHFA